MPGPTPSRRYPTSPARLALASARFVPAAALVALALPTARAAWWDNDPPREAPRLESADAAAKLVLEGVRHEVDVTGDVAHVHLTETYVNVGEAACDAIYVVPLTRRVEVSGLTVEVGARRLVSRIVDVAEAHLTIGAAFSKVLAAHAQDDAFLAPVAGVGPRERVVIELDTVESLRSTGGGFELVLPAAGGRLGAARPPAWTLDVAIAEVVPIHGVTSPSHPLLIIPTDRDGVRVGFGGPIDPSRDLVLRWEVGGRELRTGALRFEGPGESTFLALVAPPAAVAPGAALPRELVVVLDDTDLMAGFPLEASKRVVRDLLADLGPRDRFDLLTISGAGGALAPQPLPPTPDALGQAEAFLGAVATGGSPRLAAALRQAYTLPRSPDAARAIVVITRGMMSIDPDVFDVVDEHLAGADLFAFGIGSDVGHPAAGGDVSRPVIDTLSDAAHSEPFVARSPAEVAAASAALRRRLSAPYLTDLRASLEGVRDAGLEPRLDALPDVRADRPVVVVGHYRATPGAGEKPRLTLSGRTASGPWSRTLDLDASPASPRHAALPLRWARARLVACGLLGCELPLSHGLSIEHQLLLFGVTDFVAEVQTLASDGSVAARTRAPIVVRTAPNDADGDGIVDDEDKCPAVAGDGCFRPEPGPLRILETVRFASGSASLTPAGRAVLDELADVLADHAEIRTVELQGHTDSVEVRSARGPHLDLARARAVRAYLIQKGVAPERLVARGYGADKPIDTPTTRDGRARNRRVQFFILDPQGE